THAHTAITYYTLFFLAQKKIISIQNSIEFRHLLFITFTDNEFKVELVKSSSLLESPGYYFLAHLSFIDACYSCVNNPKVIVDSLYVKKISPFNECMMPIFGEHLFSGANIILLTAMAYDHYVAICKPLHYTTLMNWQVCDLLIGVSWVGGFLHATIQILFIIKLPFCGPTVIDHFMCDLNPSLDLACTDTHTLVLFVAANSGFISLLNFLLLIGCYAVILHPLKTQSLEAQQKALSACVSHITAVVFFFLPCIFEYLRPATSLPIDKAIAVFYTMIKTMLTPLIYTLRNDQMKNAIRKLCSRKATSGDQ
ncbi:hypothetical protein K5549_020241, partial [Capra hircus]